MAYSTLWCWCEEWSAIVQGCVQRVINTFWGRDIELFRDGALFSQVRSVYTLYIHVLHDTQES